MIRFLNCNRDNSLHQVLFEKKGVVSCEIKTSVECCYKLFFNKKPVQNYGKIWHRLS